MRFKKPTKKIVIIASSIVVIIGALIIALLIRQHNNTPSVVAGVHPGFQTILPSGSSIKDLGGWERISPSSSDPVYAYSDALGGTSISVSEQPLPASFKDSTDAKVADLAKGYNATTKIDAKGTTVYIGNSAKGPQSTIFVKKGLLILIKSQAKIDTKTWTAYVSSLK